jgi:hypothetical protein
MGNTTVKSFKVKPCSRVMSAAEVATSKRPSLPSSMVERVAAIIPGLRLSNDVNDTTDHTLDFFDPNVDLDDAFIDIKLLETTSFEPSLRVEEEPVLDEEPTSDLPVEPESDKRLSRLRSWLSGAAAVVAALNEKRDEEVEEAVEAFEFFDLEVDLPRPSSDFQLERTSFEVSWTAEEEEAEELVLHEIEQPSPTKGN